MGYLIQNFYLKKVNNNKRNKMKNYRKIGISALAGSLAMFSVNADIGISGSSELTYTKETGFWETIEATRNNLIQKCIYFEENICFP